jgi:hypothetical protein
MNYKHQTWKLPILEKFYLLNAEKNCTRESCHDFLQPFLPFWCYGDKIKEYDMGGHVAHVRE